MEWENLHYLKIIAGVEQNTIAGVLQKYLIWSFIICPQQPDMQAGNTVLQQVF